MTRKVISIHLSPTGVHLTTAESWAIADQQQHEEKKNITFECNCQTNALNDDDENNNSDKIYDWFEYIQCDVLRVLLGTTAPTLHCSQNLIWNIQNQILNRRTSFLHFSRRSIYARAQTRADWERVWRNWVRGWRCMHICTISFWRFKKNTHLNKRIFQFNIITLSLVACIVFYLLNTVCICVFFSLFTYLFSRSVLFSWLHTHNGMFTQCLRSNRSSLFFFFISSRFVSFYVLNIALISFRCGFSLFDMCTLVYWIFQLMLCAVCVFFYFHIHFISFGVVCNISFGRFVRARVANIVINSRTVFVTSYFSSMCVFFNTFSPCYFRLAGESYFHYKHIKMFLLKTCDRN